MMNVGRSIVVGLSTLIIVPTLSLLSFGLVVGAILTVIIGALRTFGMEYFQMNLSPSM
ncbi:hypothetical protein ACFSCX_21235 [Bacillus salitolerans]|uniref:Uncharacterized protein n=1 Tax=Bacillus salitolerans TaxID=1437434 RepID=A0ABW4LVF8_9BACI